MRELGASTSLAALRWLDLSLSPFAEAGGKALAAAPLLRQLTSLDVSQCQLGDEGARAFAGSPHLGKLRRLGLRHNSTVELVDRSVREGLLNRKTDPEDRRRALLLVTQKGKQLLNRLSDEHARELNELGPRLERALKHLRLHSPANA